jgi:hypothetical protein
MPGMPYHLEKGPYLSVMEDYVNDAVDGVARIVAGIAFLRQTPPNYLADLPPVSSSAVTPPPGTPGPDLNESVGRLWQGMRQAADGSWTIRQAPYNAYPNDHTGYWAGWYGDAERLIATTLLRALEVQIGITPGAVVPNPWAVTRHWRLNLLWKCPQPWFEGWISWRRRDNSLDGQVDVLFCTPGNGSQVWGSPNQGGAEQVDTSNIDHTGDRQGLWLVCQPTNAFMPCPSSGFSPSGTATIPRFGATVYSQGDPITIAPSEGNGGVKPNGRGYVP